MKIEMAIENWPARHQNHYHIREMCIALEDGMPKAKNLREAYNNFYVEPLKEDQEFTEFYVERPGISPMTNLRNE